MLAKTLGMVVILILPTFVMGRPLKVENKSTIEPAVSVAPTTANTPQPPVRPTMQKFAEQLSFLLQNMPALGHPNKEQRNKVTQALGSLRDSAHAVQGPMLLHAVDPVMPYLLFDLSKQFSGIQTAYSDGQYGYARYLLRRTTQTCVACHSASSNKMPAVMTFPEPMAGLGNLERAEYFAATRRHEDAILAYEGVLKDHNFRLAQPERWQESLENLIAITIRLRNDPHLTLEMCSSLLEDKHLSPPQRALLQAWRASVKTWAQEKRNENLSPGDTFIKAQTLLEQAKVSGKKDPQFAYIEYLRAMSLLNDIAMTPDADALKAHSFLIAGETSQKLKNILVWSYPEAYYEACIRIRPHTAEARTCWTSLQSYGAQEKLSTLSPEMFKQLQDLAL